MRQGEWGRKRERVRERTKSQYTHLSTGCSSPVDICSVSHNEQFLLFSAGPMSYGFWSDAAFFSQEFAWMGARAFDLATLRTLLSHKHFEAEIQYIPVEDGEDVMKKKERCFNR